MINFFCETTSFFVAISKATYTVSNVMGGNYFIFNLPQ